MILNADVQPIIILLISSRAQEVSRHTSAVVGFLQAAEPLLFDRVESLPSLNMIGDDTLEEVPYYFIDLSADVRWKRYKVRFLLLILEYIDERANVRSHLYRKFVASLQSLLGCLAHADTGGCAGDDDCSCW